MPIKQKEANPEDESINISELKLTHMEMIKGIKGHGYKSDLIVPIIENTCRENQLEESLRIAMAKYPNSNAILVRRHGVYIWGDDWISAKTQAECYHYLFKMAVDSYTNLQVDLSGYKEPLTTATASNCNERKAIVLDIEGTIAPITFVKDVLFPFFMDNYKQYMEQNKDCTAAKALLSHLDDYTTTIEELYAQN